MERPSEMVGRIAVRALTALGTTIARPEVRWLAPPERGPRVYFANHTSHLDFILIWSALPEDLRGRTRPVAAADYWGRASVRAYLARPFHPVLIERDVDARTGGRAAGGNALARMVEALDGESSLILFPQGTRASSNGTAPFKAGIYHLCRERPGLELVPVRIENAGRALPKGSFVPTPTRVRVTFRAPITLEPGEEKGEFLERARQAVLHPV